VKNYYYYFEVIRCFILQTSAHIWILALSHTI